MDRTPLWQRYLRFFGSNINAEVEDELQFHLDTKTNELVEQGWAHETAQAEAQRQFGNMIAVRQLCQQLRKENENRIKKAEYIAGWHQDLLYGVRQMHRRWITTALAVFTLGLGIGAVAAVFSIINAVILRPLPFPDPDRIVTVWSTKQGLDDVVTPRNFESWRNDVRSFTELAALEQTTFTLSEGGTAVQVPGGEITADFFRTFGVSPSIGRTFTPQEDRPPRLHLVVLSHRLWRERFAADQGILGRQIRLNREPYTVIGVMPARFDLRVDGEQLWIPLGLNGEMMSWSGVLYVFGRLRPDVTLRQAQAEMVVEARILQSRYPGMNRGRDIRVREFSSDLVGDYSQQLLILLAAVGSVLLIACANVGNLLLARGAGRSHELTIRAALGATRSRITRQLLTETLLLAFAGAMLGLLVSESCIRAAKLVANSVIPRLDEASIDGTVLLVVLGLTLATTLLCGSLPALRAARLNLQHALAQSGRSSDGLARDRARNVYIAIQAGLALVLLIGAGLLIRTAIAAQRVQPGFSSDRLVTGRTALPPSAYHVADQVVGAYQRILDTLAREPGVRSAALTSKVPLARSELGLVLKPAAVVPPLRKELSTELQYVSPGYFATMKIPVLRGRDFDTHDHAGSAQVLLVNETLAHRLWPGLDPVGQQVRIPEFDTRSSTWEVVGVVADAHDDGLVTAPPAVLYVPFAQVPIDAWQWTEQSLYLVARTQTESMAGSDMLRSALKKVDGDLPLGDVRTMHQRLAQSVSAAHFYTLLLTILGLCGLILTGSGIYGVVAYSVSRQRAEIGVRAALGATRGKVLLFVMRQGMRPVLAGTGGGIFVSTLVSCALGSQLYGVGSVDPMTFAAVSFLLILIAALACYVPARAAASVDPMTALRNE